MKVCIKCNKEKENSEFKPKSEKCIECYREYQANYRAKNKENKFRGLCEMPRSQ